MPSEKPSGSYAVMAQKHDRKDVLEHFPTPPWATRALCEWLGGGISLQSCWEPACAEGHMARPLAEYFKSVFASDIHDYGFGKQGDFLWPCQTSFDWIITNPPFRLGEQFASHALSIANDGVALLVRTAFLESADRHGKLFKPNPPTAVLQFVERVPMQKGILNRYGSTATAYCWIVWRKCAVPGTRFHWIAPCRKRLERDSDYPVSAAEMVPA
jgi:hypothetical protein